MTPEQIAQVERRIADLSAWIARDEALLAAGLETVGVAESDLRSLVAWHTTERDALTALLQEREALRAAVDRLTPKPPKPIDHYWTPDPTNRFCVRCGDNGFGSPWGAHRFQIQPNDPDFKGPRIDAALLTPREDR